MPSVPHPSQTAAKDAAPACKSILTDSYHPMLPAMTARQQELFISQDFVEGVAAFVEQRPARLQGR